MVEHPANYDGKDYPITGSTQADVIAQKHIDPCTSEAILKHAARVWQPPGACIDGWQA